MRVRTVGKAIELENVATTAAPIITLVTGQRTALLRSEPLAITNFQIVRQQTAALPAPVISYVQFTTPVSVTACISAPKVVEHDATVAPLQWQRYQGERPRS